MHACMHNICCTVIDNICGMIYGCMIHNLKCAAMCDCIGCVYVCVCVCVCVHAFIVCCSIVCATCKLNVIYTLQHATTVCCSIACMCVYAPCTINTCTCNQTAKHNQYEVCNHVCLHMYVLQCVLNCLTHKFAKIV